MDKYSLALCTVQCYPSYAMQRHDWRTELPVWLAQGLTVTQPQHHRHRCRLHRLPGHLTQNSETKANALGTHQQCPRKLRCFFRSCWYILSHSNTNKKVGRKGQSCFCCRNLISIVKYCRVYLGTSSSAQQEKQVLKCKPQNQCAALIQRVVLTVWPLSL